MNFAGDSGAHPALLRALDAKGYAQPTIQEAVLAAGNVGRDLLVSAETGSGGARLGLALAQTLLGEKERLDPPASPAP